MKVTALITCFKEGELLWRAHRSLESQTDQDFEVVIVNDASTDPLTNSICHQLEQKVRAKVIWRPLNGGLSAARNSGYEAITEGICVPLDADDTLPSTAIAVVRKTFLRVPSADFVFGDYIVTNDESGKEELVNCSGLSGPDGYLNPRALCKKWLLLGTSPCQKSAWQRVAGYSQAFSYDVQDVDFFMRLLMDEGRGYYIGEPLYRWHRSAGGMNSAKSPDSVRRLTAKHIDFFDTFGDGIEARKDVMWGSVQVGDLPCAQEFARQLMKRKYFSRVTLAFGTLPTGISRLLFNAMRRRTVKQRP